MKKKMTVYLGLMTIIFSFFMTPISMLAEVNEISGSSGEQVLSETNTQPKTMETSEVSAQKEEVPSESLDKVPVKDSSNMEETSPKKPTEEPAKTTVLDEEKTTLSFLGVRDEKGDYTHTEPVSKLTGESSVFFAGFKLGDFSGKGKNLTLKIVMPNQFIEGVDASDTSNQQDKKVDIGIKTTTITYTFTNMTGGFSLDVPIKLINKNYDTPEGYKLPIEVSIYEEGNPVPLDTQTMSYQYTLKKYAITKFISLDGQGGTWTDRDNQEVYAGEEDPDKPGYVTSDIAKTEKVRFSITNDISPGIYGGRYLEKIIVEDKLPDGAVFLPEDNPDWTYDSVTRIAKLEKIDAVRSDLSYRHILNLRFPGVKVKTLMANEGTVTAIPKEKPDYEKNMVGTDSITFKLKTEKTKPSENFSLSVRKYAVNSRLVDDPKKPEDKENWEVEWQLSANTNETLDGVYDVSLHDHSLDSRMKYTKVELPQTTNFESMVTLSAIRADGQKEVISDSIDLSKESFFYTMPVDTDYRELFLEGQLKDGNKGYQYKIFTKLINPSEVKVPEDKEYTRFSNTLKATFTRVGVTKTKIGTHYAELYRLSEPMIALDKERTGEESLFLNQKSSFYLKLTSTNLGTEENRTSMALQNVVVVDILPLGAEYVENSAMIIPEKTNKQTELRALKKPQIIRDYKNTGRVALIWTLNDFNIETTSSKTDQEHFLYIIYDVKTTKNSVEGNNKNAAFLLFDSSDGVQPNKQKLVNDIYKIGKDKLNQILGATDSFNYIPPKELITYKEVKGNVDQGVVKSPGVGHSEIGEDGSYFLNIYNNSAYDQSILSVIDVFPHVGDKNSSKDKDGERKPRHSDFSIKLTGEIAVPEGYTLYYTTDEPDVSSEKINGFFQSASWQTQVADYGEVTAIKVVMDQGHKLKAGASIRIEVPFTVPNNKELVGKSAVNSFGTATNSMLDFFESNNISLKLMKYRVDGFSFEDKNKDGLFDKATEKPCIGCHIELLDKAGSPVLDDKGMPIETLTDNFGYYSMDVYKHGDYQVRISTPDNSLITVKNPDEESGSHINQSEKSDLFTLDMSAPEKRVNGGYFIDPSNITSVTVTKKWEDEDNLDGHRPSTIKVQLLADGVKKDEVVELTEVDKWTTSWSDLPLKNKGELINYTVEEEEVPGYTVSVDDSDKGNIVLTNTHEPEKTKVEGKKIWEDKDNQDGKRKEKVTINLLANGKEVDSKDVTEATGWSYQFTELPKYVNGDEIKYTVTENSVPDYSTSIKGYDVTNSYTPEKTSVTVTKSWEDKNNLDGHRPSIIKVQLLADGKELGKAVDVTEADNWTKTWSDLPLKAKGELINYTVEEESVSGYVTTVDDTNKGNIKITNTHEPEKTKVEGKKIWEDNDNQDGKRKELVTINLLANGKEVDSKEVTEAMSWSYQFTELPKYANGDEIKYTVTENQVPEYNTTIRGYDVINSYTPGKTSVTMTKSWEDNNNQDGKRPSIIKVQLLADGEKKGKVVELTSADKWTKTWSDLPLKAKGELIDYTVEEVSVPDYVTTVDDKDKGNIKLANTYNPEVTAIKGKKTWQDNDNQDGKRPKVLKINLLANGKEVDSTEVTETSGWVYEFTRLPKYDKGQEIKYTVTENQIPEYNTTITGYDVTNSYTPGKTSVTMTKSWEDNNNQDGKRPSIIKVQLLADGEKKGKVVDLTSADNWTKTWNDLPLKAKGELINYTVEEIAVPGYVTTVDDKDKGNVKLTNTHNPEVTTIKGKKTWQDNDNQDGKRPKSLKINLLANGKEVDSTEVTEASGWVYGFSQLPKYEAGKEIVYTVTENQIPEYSTTIKGYDVTNSYTPGKTSVTMTKSWEDNNNQDGKRPSIIKVQLLADGEKKGEVVDLTSADNWTKTWSSLPLKAKGKLINYTVKEIAVPGYVTTVDDTDKGNIKLTNSYQLEKTSVKGSKIWEDNDNQDGKRPNQVKVNLLANGKEVDSTEVTKATNWTYEFTELAKYESGKEITYTVAEDQVPEYNTTIKGYEITNRYTPGKTSVSVTKSWEDDNDRDRKRPSIIKVQLFANGEKKEKAVELSSGNKWTTTWNNLPLKAKGKLVRYTIEEVSETGYQVTIDDTNPGNIKLTNTRQSEQTAIKGSKIWEDNDNQDGKRPNQVKVNLLANGKEVDSIDVTKATDWTYEFTELPKYESGEEIVYTVTEDQVLDYSTTIKGYEITNSYTPEKTSVTMTKSWEDNNNQGGKRPSEIKVQLLANGEKKGKIVELTSKDNWTTTWNDLPLKADGQLIKYTIAEMSVPNYQVTISDDNHGNIKLTNTYQPEQIGIKGSKIWDDNNNQAKKRPEKVTINLLADGKEVDSTDVTKATDWTYEFTELPKYESGKKITYTVTEDQVPDYNTTIKGYDITNRYTPGKTSVTVTKRWEDNNNKNGKRPTSIKVQLLANGKKEGKPVTLTNQEDWTKTWNELPKQEKNKDINYTVEEIAVSGYQVAVDNTNQGNIKLTNTYKAKLPDKPKKKTGSSGKLLPKTGETDSNWWGSVGLIFVGSMVIGLSIRRRKEKE